MTGDPIVEIREYREANARAREVLEMKNAVIDDPFIKPYERDAEIDRLNGRLAAHIQRMNQAHGALQNIEATRPRGLRSVA